MLPGSKPWRARWVSQAKDEPAKLQICFFSALPSLESRGLQLLIASQYHSRLLVLIATLALLVWD